MQDTKQLDLIEVDRYHPDRVTLLLDIAEKQGFDIQTTDGCVEPGYDDKPVVLGDWNDIRTYKPGGNEVISRNTTPARLAALFEKLGYSVEWNDEWVTCESCQKAVRCRENSYSWRPYFWCDPVHCEIHCGNCIKDDPTEYLEFLSGNFEQCMQLDIDLTEYGYELHSDDYENGLCLGQLDNPKKISFQLRMGGITDYIFKLDGKGQFGINFSVWVKR